MFPSKKKCFEHLRLKHEVPGFNRRGRGSQAKRAAERAPLYEAPGAKAPRPISSRHRVWTKPVSGGKRAAATTSPEMAAASPGMAATTTDSREIATASPEMAADSPARASDSPEMAAAPGMAAAVTSLKCDYCRQMSSDFPSPALFGQQLPGGVRCCRSCLQAKQEEIRQRFSSC